MTCSAYHLQTLARVPYYWGTVRHGRDLGQDIWTTGVECTLLCIINETFCIIIIMKTEYSIFFFSSMHLIINGFCSIMLCFQRNMTKAVLNIFSKLGFSWSIIICPSLQTTQPSTRKVTLNPIQCFLVSSKFGKTIQFLFVKWKITSIFLNGRQPHILI